MSFDSRISKLALTSVALGVVSCLYGIVEEFLFFAMPAVICGHVALARIRRSGRELKGKRVAILGLALGYTVIVFTAFSLGISGTGVSAG